MKDSPLSKWPPVINADHVPLWARMRDFVLTIGAWLIILSTLHSFIWLILDYLADPIFELSTSAPPHWSEIWNRLSWYVYCALGLVAWICFLAIIRRKIINATKYIKTLPSPVEMNELDVTVGVTPTEVDRWHELRSVKVFVNEDNRVYKIIPSTGN
jgi:poly-beta-1,6-N-acetyl-D-glucosamine biosynthesis protein PgaD